MLRFLLKQPLNVWRSLGRLNKIEIILLLGLIYAYLAGRIYHVYLNLSGYDWITPVSLASLTAHVFILSMYLSGAFILMYLLPRQRTLIPFYTQPLEKKQFFQLTGYLYFKYQLIMLILVFPFISGLLGLNLLAGLISLTEIFLYSLIIFLFQVILYIRISRRSVFLAVQFLIPVLFYTLYVVLFWTITQPVIFDFLVLAAAALILKHCYAILPQPQLGVIFPAIFGWVKESKIGKIDFSKIPGLFPAKIQVLFNKELVGLWRNPAYRRLKMISLLVFFILLILISITRIENKDIWMTVLAGAAIWLHYSNHFNEKYVQPEPEWFFKTIPIRFHQVWLSKFFAEFLYIMVMLGLFWIVLIFTGLNLAEQLNLIGLILIFSVFILSVILNFQIMFYDDPRLAGYAYHFTIIFLLILSLNDKLVGPLISLLLLSFYFYKSYRHFKA